jgi:hypothetical protein
MFAAARANAQWTTQRISLRPGWNAVFLEAQPEPRECDALFGGLPVESVWRFNRNVAVVQFISNPNDLLPSQPDWLTWLPAGSALGSQSSLFIIEAGLPYLIKVANNAAPFVWTVHGVPSLRKPGWLRDSLNFAGFPLSQTNGPGFKDFFAHSSALDSASVYRLTNGIWKLVLNPAGTPMQCGEAFWIRSSGMPVAAAPIQVEPELLTALDFGRVAVEQTLHLRNVSTNASLQFLVRQLPSDPPPTTALPALAGPVPLSYWRDDFVSGTLGWTNLPSVLQSSVAPGATWELRLAVRRKDMASPPSGSNYLYQSLLEVRTVPETARFLVPVTASGATNYDQGYPPSVNNHPEAGLWVGSVSIDKVSLRESGALADVSAPFGFKLIVHVNANGQPLLLQKVLQGSILLTNNPNSRTNVSVLLSSESLLSQCQVFGTALRDGRAVLRRISTAAFGFRDPVPMANDLGLAFGTNGSQFTCRTSLGYDDGLNPFVHRFHPDHNNLTDRMTAYQPATNSAGLLYTPESWTILRTVQLAFTASASGYPGAGDTQVEGVYREWIQGLNSSPLQVQGSFQLNRASYLSTLITKPGDCPQ